MNFCPLCATALTDTLIDNDIRRACQDQSCGYVLWDNPTPVVAMIVEVDTGVVLAHNVAWPAQFYSIISGFLERGEDPKDCAQRETREELNLHTMAINLVGVYPFEEQNQVIIAYHVRATGDIKLNEELDDYKIIPTDQLRGWDKGTGLAITEWLQQLKNEKR